MQYAPYIVLIFLTALTGLGVWHSRKIKTGEDFALAGRRLGMTVLIGTLVATWIGTGSLFGNAEKTFETGLTAFILPLSGALGIVLLSFLAPLVREVPAGSVPQILGLRYGRAAQTLGAIALIGAYLIIVSYQFRAGAVIAERLFPKINANLVPLLPIGFAVFIVLYTVLAGMVSVAWTDLINGIVMCIGLMLALGWAYTHWDPVAQPIPVQLKELGGGAPLGKWIGWMLPAFLLILGDANLHQRFMSASSPATARRAAYGMFVGVVILELVVIALALLGRVMLPDAPANPAHVIIDMAFFLLPPVIGIMIIAAAAAVIITTADSYHGIYVGAGVNEQLHRIAGVLPDREL